MTLDLREPERVSLTDKTYHELRDLLKTLPWQKAKDVPPLVDMTDEQLALWAAYILVNTSRGSEGTYDSAMRSEVAPELIRRLERKAKGLP